MAYYNVDKTANFDVDGNILRNWLLYNNSANITIKDEVAYLTNLYNIFGNDKTIKNVDLYGLKTNNVTNMCSLFKNCHNLVYVNNFYNTGKVKDISQIFYDCNNLSTIPTFGYGYNITNACNAFQETRVTNINGYNVGYFNSWSNLVDGSGAFSYCYNLGNLSLNYWTANNLVNLEDLFYCCNNIKQINMLNCNMNNLQTLSHIFYKCENVVNINISGNMRNVTNAMGMFRGCRNLVNLNMAGLYMWDKVTTLAYFYDGCRNLIFPHPYATRRMNNVINMFEMYSDSNIVSVEWDWNLLKCENMGGMFSGCYNLTDVSALQSWVLPNLKYCNAMFSEATAVTNIRLNSWKPNNLINAAMMFCYTTSLLNVQMNDWSNMPYLNNVANLFEYDSTVHTINLSGWNAPNMNDMTCMFASCSNLKTLTLPSSNFIPSTVTSTAYMFDGCSQLPLNSSVISTFRIAPNARWMFASCRNIKGALSGVNISRVKDAYQMFASCDNITSYSGTYGDNTTNLSRMFVGCSNLVTANIYYWTPSNLTTTNEMFSQCYRLQNVNMSKFKCANTINLAYMFDGCTALNNLLANGVYFNGAMYVNGMFNNCQKLNGSYILNDTIFANVMYANKMFYNCRNITYVNAGTWNLCNLMYANYMFDNCINMTSINTTGWNLANLIYCSGMFYNCNKLTESAMDNIGRALLTAKNLYYKNLNPNNSYSPFYGSNRNSTWFGTLTILSQLAANGWTQ